MISVIILTKNEERDLPSCIDSLHWCDDVHVVDSGSTDSTIEIAQARKVQVLSNRFESFGKQRNWAIDCCAIKHPWILFLDADEQSTDEFEKEIKNAVQEAVEDVAGFYCCWKMMLEKRWLRRSDNFPKWQFRMLRKGRARFTDVGHGQKEGKIDGILGYIKEPYLHFAFSRGWDHWEEKHRIYAQKEARERASSKIPTFLELFHTTGSQRNIAIKKFVSRIPGWPSIRFLYSYGIKGGWMEGKEGWEYCRRIRWYESLIKCEIKKLYCDS